MRHLRPLVALLAVAMLAAACTSPSGRRSSAPPGSPGATPSATPSPSLSVPPGVVFAPDACVSFPATTTPERGVVVLDAGHGGPDTGARGRTSDGARVEEKAAALDAVKTATEVFRARGYRVVATRWTDTTVQVLGPDDVDGKLLTPLGVRRDLLARAACANAVGADVLLSMHYNAFRDPDVGGTAMIYNAEREFSKENLRLAQLLQRNVLAAFRAEGWTLADRKVQADTANPGGALTERGAKYGHSIILGHYEKGWVDHPSLMPGVILEPLFLTNPAEADIAMTERGRRALAQAVVAAVDAFLAGN